MISVIIPVYNVEQHISECLESIVAQTYKNIEIIVVNDGSTDKSEEIIKSYLEKFKNINYIYQENKGVSEARNLGLKNAKGEYILFVDSDDFLDKNMIEKMYNNANKYQSDVVISGHIRFYETQSFKNKIINYDEYEDNIYNGNQVLDLMLSLKVKGYLWDKLFKRDKLVENNFNLEPNRYIEDWFPVIKQISKSGTVTFVNEPLYYYRQRNESAMHNINKKLLDDYVYTVNKINNYLDNHKDQYSKECKNVFDCETFYSTIRYFYLNNCVVNQLKKQSNIYKIFYKSNYYNYIKFSYSFFINKKIALRLKLKVLLWKLRVFHLFIKNE
jgi:glycosyltransferase involved in cell wall biosynthesis